MKTKNSLISKIKAFAIDEDKKALIINDGEIEIVFKDLFYFKIIKFILDKMKTSSIEAATGEEICGEFRSTPRGVKRKRPEDFRPFYNAWIGGFTKCHKNSQYFSVNYNKKLWEQDNKRRNFLSKFFLKDEHSLPENTHFWLNVPRDVLTIQPYSKYIGSLKETFESEFPTPTNVLTSDYVKLEVLPLKSKRIEKQQAKPLELPKDIMEVIKNNKTLAIVGDAGSGKSFILHKVVMDCANNRLSWIPIYVKLLNVPSPKGLENWIDLCFFEKFDPNLTIDKLKSENNKEMFIFLFDGIDEAGSIEDRRKMESAMLNLMNEFKESRCVITTRPVGYEKTLPNFTTFEIEPLDEQIPEVVSKFFKKDKEKLDKVLHHLEDDKFKELASNPYQLFLICNTVKHDGELARNKGQVFRNFIESIKTQRERPKREKGIYEYFDLLEEIFKQAAFQIIDKDMRYVKEETLCSIVKKAKEKNIHPDFQPLYIINEYVVRSGFLQRIYDKNKVGYNFIHLAWGDYFAACYLKEIGQEELLCKIRSELLEYMKWDDTISLLAGIVDDDTSDKIINLLINFDPFFAARCFPTAKNVSYQTKNKLISMLANKLKNNILPNIQKESINGLASIKSKEAFEQLFELLKKSKDNNILVHVIDVLGETKSEKVVKALSDLFIKNTNKYIRMYIGFVLDRIGSIKAVKALINLFKETKDREIILFLPNPLREQILEKTAQISMKKKEEETTPFINLLQENKDVSKYVLLGEIKSPNIEKVIIKMIEGIKGYQIWDIAEIVHTVETKILVSPLIKLLKKSTDTCQILNIVEIFSEIKSKKAEKVLIDLLKTAKNEKILESLVFALGKIKSPYVIEAFIKLIKKGEKSYHFQDIRKLLGKINFKKAEEILIKLLKKTKDSHALHTALHILGETKSEKTTRAIIHLLKTTKDKEVIVSAINAIGEIKSPNTVHHLLELLKESKDGLQKRSIMEALSGILPNMNREKAEEILIKLLKENKDSYVLWCATNIIGEIKSEKAVEPLTELFEDTKDTEYLECIIRILSEVSSISPAHKNKKTIRAFKKIFELSKNRTVKDIAWRGIQNIKDGSGKRFLKELEGFYD